MNKRLYRQLVSAVVLPIFIPILVLSLILSAPALSWAAAASSNQATNQPASLVAPEPDAKISIYFQPEANKKKAGYGVNDDAVTVLERVDNQSLTWNHIRFDNSPYAEGWVQETFLSINARAEDVTAKTNVAAETGRQNQRGLDQRLTASNGGDSPAENRYLGNRQPQSSQRSQFNQRSQSNQRSQFNQRSQSNQQNSAQSYTWRSQN